MQEFFYCSDNAYLSGRNSVHALSGNIILLNSNFEELLTIVNGHTQFINNLFQLIYFKKGFEQLDLIYNKNIIYGF